MHFVSHKRTRKNFAGCDAGVADCNEKTATMEISKTPGQHAHRSNAVGSADVVCI